MNGFFFNTQFIVSLMIAGTYFCIDPISALYGYIQLFMDLDYLALFTPLHCLVVYLSMAVCTHTLLQRAQLSMVHMEKHSRNTVVFVVVVVAAAAVVVISSSL